MLPLFVSYSGHKSGMFTVGWVVLTYDEPIINGESVTKLCEVIETNNNYDKGTVVITNFRRLESEQK